MKSLRLTQFAVVVLMLILGLLSVFMFWDSGVSSLRTGTSYIFVPCLKHYICHDIQLTYYFRGQAGIFISVVNIVFYFQLAVWTLFCAFAVSHFALTGRPIKIAKLIPSFKILVWFGVASFFFYLTVWFIVSQLN